jgi:hypothetical protein
MKNQNLPIYYLSEATQVIYDNISPELRAKYPKEQIFLLLVFMDDYYDLKGINVYEGEGIPDPDLPLSIDEDQLVEYICKQSFFHGIHISETELKEILEAELLYCEKLGIINHDKK